MSTANDETDVERAVRVVTNDWVAWQKAKRPPPK